jgi:hypothetical protein
MSANPESPEHLLIKPLFKTQNKYNKSFLQTAYLGENVNLQ